MNDWRRRTNTSVLGERRISKVFKKDRKSWMTESSLFVAGKYECI